MNAAAQRYAELLHDTTLFSGMTPEETTEAFSRMEAQIRQYPRGSILHHAGQELRQFGIVLEGTVQVCKDDLEGNRLLMAAVSAGGAFGESLCYLRVRESPVYILSMDETTVLWLSPHALFDIQTDAFSALLRNRFTAMLARRALDMNSRIQILSRLSIRDKLMTFFSSQAYAAGSDSFRVPFNREDMAAYIGVNRSALSRELSRMKREGILEFERDRFRILSYREMD